MGSYSGVVAGQISGVATGSLNERIFYNDPQAGDASYYYAVSHAANIIGVGLTMTDAVVGAAAAANKSFSYYAPVGDVIGKVAFGINVAVDNIGILYGMRYDPEQEYASTYALGFGVAFGTVFSLAGGPAGFFVGYGIGSALGGVVGANVYKENNDTAMPQPFHGSVQYANQDASFPLGLTAADNPDYVSIPNFAAGIGNTVDGHNYGVMGGQESGFVAPESALPYFASSPTGLGSDSLGQTYASINNQNQSLASLFDNPNFGFQQGYAPDPVDYNQPFQSDAPFDGGGFDSGPVVLDLTGAGIAITPLDASTQYYGMAGDGYLHHTAWTGAGNGVLVLDTDGNGQIVRRDQIVFTDWDPTATTDMQALRDVFDTNHDGNLDHARQDRTGAGRRWTSGYPPLRRTIIHPRFGRRHCRMRYTLTGYRVGPLGREPIEFCDVAFACLGQGQHR